MVASEKPNVLAVIPARGGSKRFPRKNIHPLNGKPLIEYTINAACNAESLTHWLVSTEDEEILSVARSLGAPVPFKRPIEIATDEVRNIDVLIHALHYMETEHNIKYDIIVLLQPTSPIRSSSHIDEAVKLLWKSDSQTLASVKGPFKKRDPILKKINEYGELVSYCNYNDEEPFYIYNAALYAIKRNFLLKNKKFVSDKQVPLVMDKYHSIDIDEYEDLLIAEQFLKYIDKAENNNEK